MRRDSDFLRVKIYLAEWLLTLGETRLQRSRLARIACDADYILRDSMQESFSLVIT